MLGADARIIEPRRKRIGLDNLAVAVLQDIAVRAVKNSGLSCTGERLRIVALGLAPSSGLNTDLFHVFVVAELIKGTDRVAAAAHAGQQVIDAPARFFFCLRADLIADAGLEIPHNGRIRVRAHR